MDVLQWKVTAVIRETPDTFTYVLEETQGIAVTWEAGQSLTFLFTHDHHEVRRSYSICTTPGVDKHIAITVKKKENGEISRYILNNWRPGTRVTSLPPAGRFIITTDATVQRHIYFIAAGSGIVPIFGLIKKVLYEEPLSHITLFYQNHDERNIIYHKPLQQLAMQYPRRFTRIDLLSNPVDVDTRPLRLNNWLLEKLVTGTRKPETGNSLFYTCGPESFMRMVQFTLRVMGFSEDQLRKEHFVIEPVRKPAFTLPPDSHAVLLHYAGQTYEFTTAFPDTILKAAQKQGIALPYSCNTAIPAVALPAPPGAAKAL
jgi:ring-1,2-phenylacetyl-CoA epoxidase subunit PaaE